MARLDFDDSKWPEVVIINGYAVFMGYLLKAVKGVGVLIVTWITVVLLGGFVSVLGKKDFWCLTGITLIQTAGVFNFLLLTEKLSDFMRSWIGSVVAVSGIVIRNSVEEMLSRRTSVIVKFLSEFLMILLMPVLGFVAIVYVFGLYISAGVSLWRLVEHDFDNGDGAANFKPALEIVYILAVLQGVLFGYRTIHVYVGARLGFPRFFSKVFRHSDALREMISGYTEDTIEGCEKDLSFATGRNLATYAVDLVMEAKSNEGFIAGIRALGTLISMEEHSMLAKHLLGRSPSLSHLIHRLLETMGPRSPYSREIREHAASIVGLVAGGIRLEQFPRAIQCISSLFDTSEEYSWRPEGYGRAEKLPEVYERDWLLEEDERRWLLGERLFLPVDDDDCGDCFLGKRATPEPLVGESECQRGYCEELVLHGLAILGKLAVAEDNFKAISSTQGFLSRTMAPLFLVQLHTTEHHDEWCSMAQQSLKLMSLLTAVSAGKTTIQTGAGAELQRQISTNKEEILMAVKSILECLQCDVQVKRHAVDALLLLHLSVDTFSAMPLPGGSEIGFSGTTFIGFMLHILLLPEFSLVMNDGSTHLAKKSSDIRTLALQSLIKVEALPPFQSAEEQSAMMVLEAVRVALANLSSTIKGAENKAYRIHALSILADICRRYTKDDDNLKELSKSLRDLMPEVLQQINTREETTQPDTQENNGGKDLPDLEQGGVPHANGQESSSTSQHQNDEQDEGNTLHEALIDLCKAVHKSIFKEDQEWTDLLNKVAAVIREEEDDEEEEMRHTWCSAALDQFVSACAMAAVVAVFALAAGAVRRIFYDNAAEWSPRLHHLIPQVN